MAGLRRPIIETIIRKPEDFTPAWLTATLTEAGALKNGKVASLSVQTIGTGQMGSVVRLTPVYEGADAGAPKTLVGKLASLSDTSRMTGVALGVYEAEVRFYQHVADTVAIRTPRCWFAAYDPAQGWFTLLFEDVSAYETGNVMEGGTVARARLALAELVKLQASRWDDPSLKDYPWLADLSRSAGVFSLFPKSLPGFKETFGPALDKALIGLAERVTPRAVDYLQGWRGPFAIQHGDYRLDNMLFGVSPEHSPLVVVDWQTVRLGPPLLDAAFYLGGSLSPQQRRDNEQELIREYHDALLAAGVRDFSWQACWEGYRLHALYGFLMAVGTSMLVQQNERGLAMYKSSAERHGAHVLDLDAEALFH